MGTVRQILAIRSERRVLDAGPPIDKPRGSMRSSVKALSDKPYAGNNTMPASNPCAPANPRGGNTLPSLATLVGDNSLCSSTNLGGGVCSRSSRRCGM